MNYNERKKLINVFTFSLKSYYVKFNNIIKVFLQIYSEIESWYEIEDRRKKKRRFEFSIKSYLKICFNKLIIINLCDITSKWIIKSVSVFKNK